MLTHVHIRSPKVIEFDSETKAKGIHALILSKVPFTVIGKNEYITNDVHLAILAEKGIQYKIIV